MQEGPGKDTVLIREARVRLESALHEVILAAKDGVGLPCTCLTISENRAVNPKCEGVYEATHMVEYLVLRCILGEHLVEFEGNRLEVPLEGEFLTLIIMKAYSSYTNALECLILVLIGQERSHSDEHLHFVLLSVLLVV